MKINENKSLLSQTIGYNERMTNAERSEKIIDIFAKAGAIITYSTITEDGRLAVRCEPSQSEKALQALIGIGYKKLQKIKSLDEIIIIGTRA